LHFRVRERQVNLGQARRPSGKIHVSPTFHFKQDQAGQVVGDARAQDFAALRQGALAVDLVAEDGLEGVVAGLGVVAAIRLGRLALGVEACLMHVGAICLGQRATRVRSRAASPRTLVPWQTTGVQGRCRVGSKTQPLRYRLQRLTEGLSSIKMLSSESTTTRRRQTWV
jgi:hypothetical protein